MAISVALLDWRSAYCKSVVRRRVLSGHEHAAHLEDGEHQVQPLGPVGQPQAHLLAALMPKASSARAARSTSAENWRKDQRLPLKRAHTGLPGRRSGGRLRPAASRACAWGTIRSCGLCKAEWTCSPVGSTGNARVPRSHRPPMGTGFDWLRKLVLPPMAPSACLAASRPKGVLGRSRPRACLAASRPKGVLGSSGAGYVAEHGPGHETRAAGIVVVKQAAHHLAAGEQAGNRLPGAMQYAPFRVDAHAAEGERDPARRRIGLRREASRALRPVGLVRRTGRAWTCRRARSDRTPCRPSSRRPGSGPPSRGPPPDSAATARSPRPVCSRDDRGAGLVSALQQVRDLAVEDLPARCRRAGSG